MTVGLYEISSKIDVYYSAFRCFAYVACGVPHTPGSCPNVLTREGFLPSGI